VSEKRCQKSQIQELLYREALLVLLPNISDNLVIPLLDVGDIPVLSNTYNNELMHSAPAFDHAGDFVITTFKIQLTPS